MRHRIQRVNVRSSLSCSLFVGSSYKRRQDLKAPSRISPAPKSHFQPGNVRPWTGLSHMRGRGRHFSDQVWAESLTVADENSCQTTALRSSSPFRPSSVFFFYPSILIALARLSPKAKARSNFIYSTAAAALSDTRPQRARAEVKGQEANTHTHTTAAAAAQELDPLPDRTRQNLSRWFLS